MSVEELEENKNKLIKGFTGDLFSSMREWTEQIEDKKSCYERSVSSEAVETIARLKASFVEIKELSGGYDEIIKILKLQMSEKEAKEVIKQIDKSGVLDEDIIKKAIESSKKGGKLRIEIGKAQLSLIKELETREIFKNDSIILSSFLHNTSDYIAIEAYQQILIFLNLAKTKDEKYYNGLMEKINDAESSELGLKTLIDAVNECTFPEDKFVKVGKKYEYKASGKGVPDHVLMIGVEDGDGVLPFFVYGMTTLQQYVSFEGLQVVRHYENIKQTWMDLEAQLSQVYKDKQEWKSSTEILLEKTKDLKLSFSKRGYSELLKSLVDEKKDQEVEARKRSEEYIRIMVFSPNSLTNFMGESSKIERKSAIELVKKKMGIEGDEKKSGYFSSYLVFLAMAAGLYKSVYDGREEKDNGSGEEKKHLKKDFVGVNEYINQMFTRSALIREETVEKNVKTFKMELYDERVIGEIRKNFIDVLAELSISDRSKVTDFFDTLAIKDNGSYAFQYLFMNGGDDEKVKTIISNNSGIKRELVKIVGLSEEISINKEKSKMEEDRISIILRLNGFFQGNGEKFWGQVRDKKINLDSVLKVIYENIEQIRDEYKDVKNIETFNEKIFFEKSISQVLFKNKDKAEVKEIVLKWRDSPNFLMNILKEVDEAKVNGMLNEKKYKEIVGMLVEKEASEKRKDEIISKIKER